MQIRLSLDLDALRLAPHSSKIAGSGPNGYAVARIGNGSSKLFHHPVGSVGYGDPRYFPTETEAL
jgi:hypothetical protein